MKEERRICPACGQTVMVNIHNFSEGLFNILIKFAKKFGVEQPFHLQNDFPDMTKNQYNNAQKLRYWGLLNKYYKDGKRKGGYWYLTYDAKKVLNGDLLPRQVKTFNNKVVEYSEETLSLDDIDFTYKYSLPIQWVRRQEPVDEKQISLFGGNIKTTLF